MKYFTFLLLVFTLSLNQLHADCPFGTFPQEQSIHDIFFDSCPSWHYSSIGSGNITITLSRNVLLQEIMVLHVPELPDKAYYELDEYDFKLSIKINDDDVIHNVTSNYEINRFLGEGMHTLTFYCRYYDGEELKHVTVETKEIQVKQSDYYYQDNKPDKVWDISTDEPFQIPCSSAYPDDPENRLSKYNEASHGFAKAYIKLGEGNTELTRPVIFVEGIDFKETYYKDPAIDNIVRYGDNGWENISQGISEALSEDGEPELFRNYPELIQDLRSGQSGSVGANYDIILIDFKDGADYIQKNGQLVINLIERINLEKVCGYENIVLGLSMGGQVARYALTKMEADGLEHGSRMYFSFDSPHVMANIPLAIQSFVWSSANFYDQGAELDAATIAAQNSWYSLNRPAGIQMLKHTLNAEYQKGNLNIDMNYVQLESSYPLLVEVDSIQILAHQFFDNSLDYTCLREQYQSEMAELGYPTACTNIAVANGSGDGGEDEHFPEGSPLLLASIIDGTNAYQIAINELLYTLPDELVHIKLYNASIASDLIYDASLPFLNSYRMFKCKVSLKNDLLFLDGVTGCQRDDLKKSIGGPIDDSPLNVNLNKLSNTFMPTSSVIGYNASNLDEDLLAKYISNKNFTPFDDIYLPVYNQPHVELVTPAEQAEGAQSNYEYLVYAFPLGIQSLSSDNILPDINLGNTYNFGLYNKRVPSFTVNDGGVLSFNLDGNTGFIETSPEDPGLKNIFDCSLTIPSCDTDALIEVNSGGKMVLGNQSNGNKSSRLLLNENTSVIINAGGKLQLENDSEIIISKNSSLELNQGADVRLNGQGSKLDIKGLLKTTGDITIQCNGQLIIGSTAQFELGGKLTIIGDNQEDVLLVLEPQAQFSTHFGLDVQNGTIVYKDQTSITVNGAYLVSLSHVTLNPSSAKWNSIDNGVDLLNCDNIQLQNVSASNFLNGSAVYISGKPSSVVGVSNANINNCKTALTINNVAQAEITASLFSSTPLPGVPNYEVFNGIELSQIPDLNIVNCAFTGFGKDDDNNAMEFAMKLTDVNEAKITNTSINESGKGIFVPDTGSNYATTNKTNLFLNYVEIFDNIVGIQMYGYRANTIEEYNFGYLFMECSDVLDNYEVGITGNNVLLQADSYFGDQQTKVNRFRGLSKTGPNGNPAGSEIISITYTSNYSFSEVYLRGNIWWSTIPSVKFYDAIDNVFLPVVFNPMFVVGGQLPASNCLLPTDPQIGLDCTGCLQEDDNDCSVIVNANNESIAQAYREGVKLIQAKSYSSATNKLSDIAYIDEPSLNALGDKCKFAYEVSRVFNAGVAHSPLSFVEDYNNEVSRLKIFPNPSMDFIQLETELNGQLEVLSLSGEVLLRQTYNTGNKINVTSFHSGLYLIKLSANNGDEKWGKLVVK